MKKSIVMKAKSREKKQRNNFIGWVPGVMYGPELKENKMIWIDYQNFFDTYNNAGGSTLVDIEVEGDKKNYPSLIHDIQYHPISGRYNHVDLYVVKMGEKIETEIELNFIGESPAVKELGGTLIKSLDAVEVKCFPRDLISEIKVDISSLKDFDDGIYVKDLDVPKELELMTDEDTSVASVGRPRSDEELEGLDEKVEVDMDQVETEEKGKEKTDEEEGAEGEAQSPEGGESKKEG
ncbi:MAG: 50S ribosomal protein L25 [Candidatus Moranbacteria bacterium]|nr:50S ribosomal protein L25 [Candidatus Moranbacteria bacterium]